MQRSRIPFFCRHRTENQHALRINDGETLPYSGNKDFSRLVYNLNRNPIPFVFEALDPNGSPPSSGRKS
jgi:hypothetical protein